MVEEWVDGWFRRMEIGRYWGEAMYLNVGVGLERGIDMLEVGLPSLRCGGDALKLVTSAFRKNGEFCFE